MPDSENKTSAQLEDGQNRTLRSASPAIKRPASVMGGHDREEYSSDVEMGENSSSGQALGGASHNEHTQDQVVKQESGKRLRSVEPSGETIPHHSDPRSVSQQAPSEISTTNSSLIPSPSRTSTAATSTNDSPLAPEQLPSIDEQVLKITQLVKEPLQDKQKGYVISTKWLNRVQARSSFPPDGKGIGKPVAAEGPIGPVDNSDIAMIIEESGHLKDEAGDKFVELRPNLAMGEDYEVMPQEAWDLIVSWYGLARTSPIITRYAHDTSNGGDIPNVIYELSPPVWSFLKVPSSHTIQTQKEKDLTPPRMSNSRYAQFQTWLKQAKELLHIDISTKVRVWRILGGLKNINSSGAFTPVTSRSASPAPGAELVANAGDKMLLDVNTFAALQLGEHRELLDAKDQTNDKNYNGKATLALLGLGRNDVIVLEEQGGKAEEWPSENIKFSLGKNLQAKAKGLTSSGLTPSGRTSPAPGMMTRGRQRRDGRPRGITGLSNLGNTCYMNSALQCIRSVEELTQYFLHDRWKTELNTSNPLGHGGNIAKAYADLLAQIYGESSATSVNPGKFKATVGKYGPSFSGYAQQDSQEFLLFLLDGLQEDLNRIHKKPYIEKPDSTDEMVHDQQALKEFADKNWDIYKARNDSVVTDLFAGMYKSTVTCPVCDKVSIIFDPFNNLTLQLPIENNWQKEIIYFPLHKRPYKVDVDLDKNSTIFALKEFVGKRTNFDPNRMLMAESYKNKFFKYFNNPETISEINIGQQDIICIYELGEAPTNYNPNKKKKTSGFSMSYSREPEDELVSIDSSEADRLLIPIYHRAVKHAPNKTTRTFFGHPSVMVINREDAASYDRILKKLLSNVNNMTSKNLFEDDHPSGSSEATLEDSDTLIVTDDGSSSGSNLAKATSVEGDDSLVDVSMRDPSQPPADASDEADGGMHPALRFGRSLPEECQNLFEIRIAATGEGIPTGWNSIDENKEYPLMLDRLPQKQRRQSSSSDIAKDDDDASTSDEDIGDIPYKESKPANESGSDSGVSIPPASGNESDCSDLPPIEDIIKDTRGLKNRNRKKTYGGRDRRKQQAAHARQRQVAPQPQVRSIPKVRVIDDNTTAIIRPGDALVLDWSTEAYDALFGLIDGNDADAMRGAPTWNVKNMEVMEDEALTARRTVRMNRRKNGISLEDCLHEFGKSETLSEQNAWYCPRCKEHRRAKKMFELWKAPDILVMHLKRFSSNRSFRDKLEVRVDYPVEGLDMSEMVRDQSDGRSLIYDLIAVDNHYGGLGGGHYTAYGRNFFDGSWHDYNDSHVSKKDESSVVTSAAYLLFYRRRTDGPLGGPAIEKFISEADSEAQPGSRDASPSGEGQRLDDSSHNGSSSAYPAAQVHRVGDGGLATIQNPMNQGLHQEEENRSKLHGMNEVLPSYDETVGTDEMLLDGESIDVTAPSTWINQSWGFGSGLAGHANSDADAMEDNSSTRGEGASPPGSLPDFEDAEDSMLYSEDVDDFNRRGLRESAPAPDVPSINLSNLRDMDDDDDDLPVQELHAGTDGEMQFTPAGHPQ